MATILLVTKKWFFSTAAVLALAAMSLAQAPVPPGSANPQKQPAGANAANTVASDALAPGTLLSVELSKSLDAKKAKANDRVEARTAVDMLAHGRIVLPRNTKIIGHVTDAKAHSKASPDSMLGISFDRMLLKDGREVPLQVAVQAIARPLQPGGGGGLEGSGPSVDNPAAAPIGMPGSHTSIGASPGSSSGPSSSGPSYPREPGAPSEATATATPLDSASQGVVGIKGLAMNNSGTVSTLTSNTSNVHLDGGTQLILRVQ